MSDEVRLVDRFIPVMNVWEYWDWQRGYTRLRADDEPTPVTKAPSIQWVRVGHICGVVCFQDVVDDEAGNVRQPSKIVRFCTRHTNAEWCSDNPNVWRILEALGIKPTPAEES